MTNNRYQLVRASNVKKLQDRGLEILSDWDGTTGSGKRSLPIAVTVRQQKCGHVFTSSSKNLLNRNISCAVCGKVERTAGINNWSKKNSEEWKKTADIWQRYKSRVRSLTRQTYKVHKHTINPNNLPFGVSGQEGAYHLDHIKSIRHCFEHYVPAEVCAHADNLQVLPWRDNVSFRDKIKPVQQPTHINMT